MTGVGDEICAHPLRRAKCRAVGQPDEHHPIRERPDTQAPGSIGIANPHHLYVRPAAGENEVERYWMTDRETQVAAGYLTAEQLPSGLVSRGDHAALDDQRGFFDRIQEV